MHQLNIHSTQLTVLSSVLLLSLLGCSNNARKRKTIQLSFHSSFLRSTITKENRVKYITKKKKKKTREHLTNSNIKGIIYTLVLSCILMHRVTYLIVNYHVYKHNFFPIKLNDYNWKNMCSMLLFMFSWFEILFNFRFHFFYLYDHHRPDALWYSLFIDARNFLVCL